MCSGVTLTNDEKEDIIKTIKSLELSFWLMFLEH